MRDLVEVVVTLKQPPLAEASTQGRSLSSARTRGRLTCARRRAARTTARSIRAALWQSRIASTAPGVRFGWRYTVVANGFSVVVPRSRPPASLAFRASAKVWPSVGTGPQLTARRS